MKTIKSTKNLRGFTLLELLVTLSIVGILMALAAPNFSNMILRSKVRSALNEWQSSFYFAQSEALRLKDRITFCASADGISCSNNGDFNDGWIVFHTLNELDKDGNPVQNNVILQDVPAQNTNNLTITMSGGSNAAQNANIGFDPTGRIAGNFVGSTATFTIAQNGNLQTMQLFISSEGRLR